MAKPKMQTITRKDWDKKHKDFKLIGKDKIPYIMVYDNGTKLIPVKIIEATDAEEKEFHTKLDTLVHNTFGKSPEEMEESVASAIDQIRQDSKDIRDFLKKVFSDSDFRAMKNDKDFVQYLKSIYEGVSVNEGDGLWANIRAKKARGEKPAHKNSKAHKDAVKAGDKINKEESVVNEFDTSVNKRRAGAELKQKLKGKRSDGMGKYTSTIYGLDSKGKRVELKSLNDLNKYSKFELDESVNEGLKHNDMYTMLDIAAGYSSTQDQAANQMWSDEQDLYDYLKSDHIPKKYHKKFHNDIKRRFKDIKESVVTEGRSINAISKLQQKNIDDIAKALDFYKKNKDTDKKEAFIKVLKKLGDEKKKLAKELDDKVSGMYKDAEYKGESVVTEAKEDDVITQLRKIVKDKQNALVVDTKSKKKVRVDMQSASLMVQVYDALKQQSNKDKFVKSGIVAMGHMAYKLIKNESVNEGISVSDERHFGKKGIIIMIDDSGKKVSAIFKDKKNADKYNRNNPSDIKKLLDLAKKTKYPNAIDESVNEIQYDDAFAKFNKELENNSEIKKAAKHYKKSVKDVVKVLQSKIKVNRYSDKSIKQISINYTEDGPLSSKVTIKASQNYKQNESVNEAKDEIYFKSYTHAIEAAEVMAGKKGYTIEDDELFNKVGMNSKRPSVGKTTKVNLELLKNGKPQKKMLHIQVYGMKNGYELNAYIN